MNYIVTYKYITEKECNSFFRKKNFVNVLKNFLKLNLSKTKNRKPKFVDRVQ